MIKNENVEGEPAYDETYRRGPVVMRGPMIPKDNTYANLLAPRSRPTGCMLIRGACCAFRPSLSTALVRLPSSGPR